MLSRRSFLRAAGAAALVTPFAGFGPARAQSGGPLFRFGVVADPQYAPVPPRNTRFYSNSLWKLSDAIADFNTQEIEFVVTLGDIIDRHWESFGHILPLYDKLAVPNFFILGNHDFSVASDYLGSVLRATGLERAYYAFPGGGHRFLVLDGNEISLFANPKDSENYALAEERLAKLNEAGAANAQTWNGGISDAQFGWLESELKDAQSAGERVIVMGHYPVYPANEHNLWDDARLVDLFTSHDNFALYMNGHNHAGNYGQIGSQHFVNFRGMVETADTTAYSTLEVYDDRIEMLGKGVEVTRTLSL
ncbi:metallophosphoesterase [Pseudoruegeria sp. HB172150]|uniref:metallophosphoesterase n=1 Tax=Pseudoruegeria sp. HB172150 TaxID=2721164 RepID=UPI00155411E2|nr:metallophosphoesterase [Pseudoruegeria sp. HB172150]